MPHANTQARLNPIPQCRFPVKDGLGMKIPRTRRCIAAGAAIHVRALKPKESMTVFGVV